MALANDMSAFLNKYEGRMGLDILEPHFPKDMNKSAWANVVKEDTLVTFSRYYPDKMRFVVNDETCNVRIENRMPVYYIKDELLGGRKLLGLKDIDWQDTTSDNMSMNAIGTYGYYMPNYGNIESTFSAMLGLQMAADVSSVYNNGIYPEFTYPNKLVLKKAGGVPVRVQSFVVELLVQHDSIVTIAPTKMETFEALASADISRFLYNKLKYFDGLDTIDVNIDLKLQELQEEANKRENVIEKLENSYVSPSNENIPYLMTIN